MAFPTLFGLYQFITMLFRLHRATAAFQRLMNQILQPHNQYTAVYVNDIVLYSSSWEEHLQLLINTLQALEDVGLTVNPAKCHLRQQEMTYMGYTVGRVKLRTLIDKVQAL